jgi:hypothetical protein
MKTRILIMRPDQPHETREVELPDNRKALLADLHALLDPLVGGYFEHVRVFSDFEGGTKYRYLDMFVHETGVLDGLPRNEAATVIYRRNALLHEPGVYDAESLPFIAGPAVLFEGVVWS